MTVITKDEAVLGGEPRLEDTRISVRHVAELVREAGMDPDAVAAELGIEPVDVENSLDYYDTHHAEIQRFERRDNRRLEAVRAASRAPEA